MGMEALTKNQWKQLSVKIEKQTHGTVWKKH